MLFSKTRIIICLPLATVLLYLIHKYYYEEWSYYYRYQYLSLDDSTNKEGKYKIILLWTSYQGKWTGWTGGLGHDQILSECKNGLMNGECVLTTDKNQIHSADVVLFSLQDLKQEYLSLRSRASVFPDIPWQTRQKQLWIAMWYEPNMILEKYHYYTRDYLQSLNNKFNETITYRRDSFIKNWVYGGGCHFKRKPFGSIDNLNISDDSWKNHFSSSVKKHRLVSWIVSHCNTPSGRDRYVDAMKDVIDVDIYGNCGDLELTRGFESKVLSDYKFYLAFENSKCPDYVTEKLFRVINSDFSENPPVPVVMGPNRSWYEENLPTKSFIHVSDFATPEKLAQYLKFLSQHPNEYVEYLSWRRHYIKVCEPPTKCQLCKHISNHQIKSDNHIAIQDFESFWKKSECEKPVENSDTEQSIFLILQRLYWSLGL